jgi:hypothetical protein
MTQYLVAIHHPDDYDPSAEDEAMSRDIDALNDEMVAAGVRVPRAGSAPVWRTCSAASAASSSATCYSAYGTHAA